MTIGYNPFDEDFNYGRLDDYKQGFKDGVEALKIQAKERKFEIVTDAGNREDVVFVEDIDEICKELVD